MDEVDNCRLIGNSDQGDDDTDGVGDACDNCPDDYNPNQEDKDCDGTGDICDQSIDCIEDIDCDDDCDGFYNPYDNCKVVFNPAQYDNSPPQGNEIGDACDCEGNFDCDIDVDGTDASISRYPDPTNPIETATLAYISMDKHQIKFGIGLPGDNYGSIWM